MNFGAQAINRGNMSLLPAMRSDNQSSTRSQKEIFGGGAMKAALFKVLRKGSDGSLEFG